MLSRGAVRAAAAIFAIGLLFVWLVRPVGNACPEVDRLPSGSEGSSAPSFAPPLTRTCTYSTPDGTQARRRYVPVLDMAVLLFAAGLVGGAIALAGRRRREPRQAGPPHGGRVLETHRAPSSEQARAAPSASAEQAQRDAARRERDAAERERARRQREARRRR